MTRTFVIRVPENIFRKIAEISAKKGVSLTEASLILFEEKGWGKLEPSDISKVEEIKPSGRKKKKGKTKKIVYAEAVPVQ